ncbi:MAG: hypothetical protein N2444_04340 [Methylocystis sp.]|nr:hypothetical protein [Methylocystis sp.]
MLGKTHINDNDFTTVAHALGDLILANHDMIECVLTTARVFVKTDAE